MQTVKVNKVALDRILDLLAELLNENARLKQNDRQ